MVQEYAAILTQSGTDEPTPTIMNASETNYLGVITWTRYQLGLYLGSTPGGFNKNKTQVFVTDALNPTTGKVTAYVDDNGQIQLAVIGADGNHIEDQYMYDMSILVRVYT